MLSLVSLSTYACGAEGQSGAETFTNSLGMKMVRVEPGTFMMGSEDGEWDEGPVHRVSVSRPFFMAATEVTNAQFEQFDPAHKGLRNRHGLSSDDQEAVIYVTWHQAAAFCRWLSEKEGKPYRLPTEAEWEYACRAGTTTAYHTGESLPEKCQKNQNAVWTPKHVPLHVGTSPANAWGLHDMHGNVEEWCADWYGSYAKDAKKDPVGRENGYVKVTRGGSHGTPVVYLRSANRQAALPTDRSWLIGFRVVQGEMPDSRPLPPAPAAPWAEQVDQRPHDWSASPVAEKPFWREPIPFVKVPAGSDGPMYSHHNHCPAITWCDNGDLLAVWFSCNSEIGRELTILGSRLKVGRDQWTLAAPFFQVPDRNLTGSALLNNGQGTLYFFNGLSAAQGYRTMLALAMRTSTDNGATWSEPRLVNPRRNDPWESNQPIASVLRFGDGSLVLPSDAPLRRSGGGTALWMSSDEGNTWAISKGTIAGIHASVIELRDGRLLAFGRSLRRNAYDNSLPMSVSGDRGATWEYSESPFPAIGGGQRLVLRRLKEGPLLMVSFTESLPRNGKLRGRTFRNNEGNEFIGYGMFAALSFDEGETWPVRKLLAPDEGEYQTAGHTRQFRADATHAEPRGYLAATQTPDGVIHLISSGLHYRFNLAWLKIPNEAPPEMQTDAHSH